MGKRETKMAWLSLVDTSCAIARAWNAEKLGNRARGWPERKRLQETCRSGLGSVVRGTLGHSGPISNSIVHGIRSGSP